MLILTQRVGQQIRIGEATVTVCKIRGNEVKLGIDAPRDVSIRRLKATAKENPKAGGENKSGNPKPASV